MFLKFIAKLIFFNNFSAYIFKYMKIFLFAMRSKMNINKHSQTGKKGSQHLKTSLRIAKGLFGSFIIFALCWLAYV